MPLSRYRGQRQGSNDALELGGRRINLREPMKMTLLLSLCAIASAMLLTINAAERPKVEESGTLRHVVAFKFKSTATQEQIKQIENAFRDLKKKIPQINSYEWGLNNSPEKHNKGMTHGFIL